MKKLNRLGEKYMTNEGYEVEITRYTSTRDVEVTFENGFKVECQFIRVLKGRLKNPYHKAVCGVGFFGAGIYKSVFNKLVMKNYSTWSSMIKRCYDKKEQEKTPTYKGVTVCEEWHNFQNFAKWFEDNYIKDFHLDKDILIKGNKVYSPETCCFVPQEINCLFTNRKSKRGDLPIGVRKCGKNFVSQMTINNEKIYLGTFYTVVEAFEAYKTAKESYIKEVADKRKEKITDQVYQAMYDYKVEISD